MSQPISRLALLMQLLDITGREMAGALHVDHSLISKWKNNHRKIPVRMGMLDQVTDYLISRDREKANSLIYPLLINPSAHKTHLDKISQKELQKTKQALITWLQDSKPINTAETPDQQIQYWQSHLHYICPVEIYQSDTGRRQAVENIFDTLLSLPSEHELWLLVQEDAGWLVSDEAFSHKIKEKTRLAAEKGHAVKIIHWLNRNLDQLENMINFWLPLQFHPKIQTWYFPQYEQFGIPLTLYLIPDQVVLTGTTSFDETPVIQTMLFRDLHTIRSYESVFKGYMRESLPLLQTYTDSNSHEWMKQLYQAAAQGTSQMVYVQAERPSALLLPSPLIKHHIHRDLAKYLHSLLENQMPADINQSVTVKDTKSFMSVRHQNNAQVRHIYHLNHLIAGQNEAMITDTLSSMILGRPVTQALDQFKNMLRNLADHLQENKHFEIALLQDADYEASEWSNLIFISNHMFLAWRSHPGQARLSARESTFLHVMENYLDKRWQAIPSVCRNRHNVVTQLYQLCE